MLRTIVLFGGLAFGLALLCVVAGRVNLANLGDGYLVGALGGGLVAYGVGSLAQRGA